MSETTKEKSSAQDLLSACFMQQCQNEIDAYNENPESVLDKYSKQSIKVLPFVGLGVSSSLILLHSPLSLNASSQLIGLFVLIFTITLLLVTRYYINNKDDKKIKLDIFDSWKKTILGAIIINFGLFIFSNNPISEFLVILAFAAAALIFIQGGVKRSL